eukprot:TRINITY_DN3331_c0_g2_i7.p1 TRINITY_DN3331_c0_g2~~TRINITY_DN3331_c0_g2_i7.p1  ORF type:complete len:361 (-),score=52.20 TRINITY_DN3331_c0_g2_i7:621-1544(-)
MSAHAMKILLLGTADSGKSTFAKQLAMEFDGTNRFPRDSFIPILHENVISAIKDLVNYAVLHKVGKFEDDLLILQSITDLTPEIARVVSRFYRTSEIQEILSKHERNLQLQGGVSGVHYYLSNVDRFVQPNFHPTKQDILMARRKTVGIYETIFVHEGVQVSLVDVGGQRSERRKWLHCFSSVSAVIFLSALNEYDLVLEEDEKTNRLVESLKLWKALTSSQFFHQTPFLLFLNKSDLFRQKIKTLPLREVFQDYVNFDQSLDVCLKEKSRFEGHEGTFGKKKKVLSGILNPFNFSHLFSFIINNTF